MRDRKWIVIVVVVTIGLTLGCGLFNPGPAKTVKNFFKALDDGEIEDAMSYLSSRTIQALGEEKWRSAFVQATRELDNEGGIKSVEILDENIIGETAQISVQINYGDGLSDTDTIDLVKEDGRWKIDIDPWAK